MRVATNKEKGAPAADAWATEGDAALAFGEGLRLPNRVEAKPNGDLGFTIGPGKRTLSANLPVFCSLQPRLAMLAMC